MKKKHHAKPDGTMMKTLKVVHFSHWRPSPRQLDTDSKYYVSTGLTYWDDKNHPKSKATGQTKPKGIMMKNPKVDHFSHWL